MILEEQRIIALRILRDSLISYEKGEMSKEAIKALVIVLNNIEREMGIETRNADYYLNMFQLREGF